MRLIRVVLPAPERPNSDVTQERGGRIVFFYLTMGQYDLAFLLEMPDDNSAALYMLELNKKGTITSTTLKAFTEDEYQSIVDSIP